jgi:hypothetical protein
MAAVQLGMLQHKFLQASRDLTVPFQYPILLPGQLQGMALPQPPQVTLIGVIQDTLV